MKQRHEGVTLLNNNSEGQKWEGNINVCVCVTADWLTQILLLMPLFNGSVLPPQPSVSHRQRVDLTHRRLEAFYRSHLQIDEALGSTNQTPQQADTAATDRQRTQWSRGE